MSEPIRLPIINSGSPFSQPLVEITPEIARQIVAMAGIPRLDTDFIVSTEDRIAALESDTAWLKQHAVVGDADGRDAEPAPVDAGKPAPCPKCGGTRDECWNRRCYGFFNGPFKPADQPAGDKSAVEALADHIHRLGCESDLDLSSKDEWTMARAILAAIRRGEVPGIWCGALAENIASAQLVADLRAKLAEANGNLLAERGGYQSIRQEWATHRCKVCGALWHRLSDGGWTLCSLKCGKCCDNVPMGEQIEAFGLTARVAELERERDMLKMGLNHNGQQAREIAEDRVLVMQERDKALADLAAMTERAHMADAELTAEREKHDKQLGDEILGREFLEQLLEEAVCAFDPEWEWSNINTPTKAVTTIVQFSEAYDAARAEADALRKEVDALKGRKVILPLRVNAVEFSSPLMLEQSVVNAIRAAGVGVES